MTYGGRWEQLKSGAATHLPIGAGHNRMHTAKAGLGMENFASPCFFTYLRKWVNCKLFLYFAQSAKKRLETEKKISYNTPVYVQEYCALYKRTMRGIDYMSASDKKKLRKEEREAALTERQKKEQKEAKQLKAYTLTFAILMVLVVAIVVGVVVSPMIEGIVIRNTQALSINGQKVMTNELSYFYFDAINEHQQTVYNQYYSQFGDYWSMMLGFDSTQALTAQTYNSESGLTWAQYFADKATENAADVYALYNDATAKGFSITAEEQQEIDSYMSSLELYATYYGYNTVNGYLRAQYGEGATLKSYKEYYTKCSIASSYLEKYSEELSFKDEDFRAYEKDKYDTYSTLSYVYYTMKYDSYLGEGTKGEDGKTTWTDEEKEAARKDLKADMEAILAGEVKDKESFDKAIHSLKINTTDKNGNAIADDKKPNSTEVKRTFIDDIYLHAGALEWLKEADRKEGDFKAFEVYTYAEHADAKHEHGDECGCSRTVDGYTIVLFVERNDNTDKMVNVRHILVKFTGGTTGSDGKTTYTQEQKDKAKAEAEALLKKWKEGKANEESFGELANAESDDQDGKVTNGGLYEDIYPGQMVEPFENWCFADGRKAGDTGLVETEYGWHVMYFSSYDEVSYRDMLIENDMRQEQTEKWHDGLVDKMTVETVNLTKLPYDHMTAQ